MLQGNNTQQTCEFCKNFRQHYIRVDGMYIAVYAGHCACLVKRTDKKGKKPNDDGCRYYELKEGNKPWRV